MRAPIEQSLRAAVAFLVSDDAAAAVVAASRTLGGGPASGGAPSEAAAAAAAHLDSLVAVQKQPADGSGSDAQSVVLLSLRALGQKLADLQSESLARGRDGDGGQLATGSGRATLFQRYVMPGGLVSSALRVQWCREKRPRAWNISAPLPLPRPLPTGQALEGAAAHASLIASASTAGARADAVRVCGGEWVSLMSEIESLSDALRRALRLRFDEIVFDVLRGAQGTGNWLLQVKAFVAGPTPGAAAAAAGLPPPAPTHKAAVPGRDCMGDYCFEDVNGEPAARAGEPVPAVVRMPFRWLSMDRLGASVVERLAHLQSGDEEAGVDASQASQLKALAAVWEKAHGGGDSAEAAAEASAAGARLPLTRTTAATLAKTQALRRLYAPAHGHAGGDLVCVAANRAAQQMPHTLNARCLPYAATVPTHRAAPVRLAPLAPSHGYS